MKHWAIDDVAWDRFDRSKVDPAMVPLVKSAAMVERNGTEYAAYLCRVFSDDPDFQAAAERWSVEEVQHGDALRPMGKPGRPHLGLPGVVRTLPGWLQAAVGR